MADVSQIEIASGVYNVKDEDARAMILNKKREFILLGDSFGAGITGTVEGNVKGWVKHFKDIYTNAVVYDGTELILPGNSGFTSSLKFKTMLETIVRKIPNLSTITDIVVLGGTNDKDSSADAIEIAIKEFVEYVKSTFPTINRIAIGNIGTEVVMTNTNITEGYKTCLKYGAEYISDTLNLMCDRKYNSDGTHITEAGYKFYSPYIAEAVYTGHTNYVFDVETGFINSTNKIRITITPHGYNFCPITTKGGVGRAWFRTDNVITEFNIQKLVNVSCLYNINIMPVNIYAVINGYHTITHIGNCYLTSLEHVKMSTQEVNDNAGNTGVYTMFSGGYAQV